MAPPLLLRRRAPVYLQIAEALETEIKRDHPGGAMLPSELALAERFGVSRLTLRRAVDELVDAGLVARRHGVGLVVLDAAIDYRIGAGTRFTAMLEEAGHSTCTTVLRKQLRPADVESATALGLAAGTPTIWIETQRLVDGRPFCLTSHVLPHAGMEPVLAGYDGGSLHGFVERQCGVRLRRQRSLISAPPPAVEDARRLGVGQYHAVLRVDSVNVDVADGLPREHAVSRFRGDRVQLEVPIA